MYLQAFCSFFEGELHEETPGQNISDGETSHDKSWTGIVQPGYKLFLISFCFPTLMNKNAAIVPKSVIAVCCFVTDNKINIELLNFQGEEGMRQASEERNSLTRVVHFAAYHEKTTFGKKVSESVCLLNKSPKNISGYFYLTRRIRIFLFSLIKCQSSLSPLLSSHS